MYDKSVEISTVQKRPTIWQKTAQWEGMGDVGLARYEPALLPPCPTIRVLKVCTERMFSVLIMYHKHIINVVERYAQSRRSI